MEKNMHIIDRIIRGLLAVNIAGYFYFFKAELTYLNLLLICIAVLSSITVLLNFCPIYDLLGLRYKKNS
jgi:hypothetical protein